MNLGEYTFEDGRKVPWKYTKLKYAPEYKRIEMTEEEKFKVDNKTSTLSMPERIFILDGFSPEVLTKEG